MEIPFNKPPVTGKELEFIKQAMQSDQLSGNGPFSKKCEHWFEQILNCAKAILTPSCTQALEMAAFLIDIQPGDEVIMPSFTFVSTANAFALRGAKIVFIDVHPETMNMDERLLEEAITAKTKAIVPVHYGGVACNMELIMEMAEKHHIYVIEDAAQAINCSFHGKPLGSFGHFSAFSFHETKNCSSGGEGGLLVVNDAEFVERAEIIRDKGTNRSQFFRGMVDKYTWIDLGSSYLPSEIQSAYLWAQLQESERIKQTRLALWHSYFDAFQILEEKHGVQRPFIPSGCDFNAHVFYLKMKDIKQRSDMIQFLKNHQIDAVFHYVPLHSSPAGKKFGRFFGKDVYTTQESERLMRLPLFNSLKKEELHFVTQKVLAFFGA